jgi:ferredoxin-type protein NapH
MAAGAESSEQALAPEGRRADLDRERPRSGRPAAFRAPGQSILARVLAVLSAALGVVLPLIPDIRWRYWSTGYVVFLAALLVAPIVLVLPVGRRGRFFLLLAALALLGFLQLGCARPTGALELALLGLATGRPWLVHGVKLAVWGGWTLLFSRYYCGLLCPNGAVQELLHRPGLGVRMPPRGDRLLGHGRYLMLLLLVAFPLIGQVRLFEHVGPFRVLFNLQGSSALVTFFGVVVLASVLLPRPFCRYLCPIAGLQGLLARCSLLRMRLDAARCSGCRRCVPLCPVGAISPGPGGALAISSGECIACRECEEVCPQGALYFGRPARASARVEPMAAGQRRRITAHGASPALAAGARR